MTYGTQYAANVLLAVKPNDFKIGSNRMKNYFLQVVSKYVRNGTLEGISLHVVDYEGIRYKWQHSSFMHVIYAVFFLQQRHKLHSVY